MNLPISWHSLVFASNCVVLSCLLSSLTTSRGVAQESQRPNFVFIMADDLGWADVAFHGGKVPTPHLDRMAHEGLELTQHYVAPVCSPTRTGLLTGRYWSRFGVVNPQNEQALPSDTVTLASALSSIGYRTCLIGKWHLGSTTASGPNHFGFQHSYGSLAGGVSPWNHRYKQGPFSQTWHRNEQLLEEEGHVTDLLTQEAIKWLDEQTGSPFFLYLPYTAVHLPVKEPQVWLDQVPSTIRGQGKVAHHYAACIMHLDASIGKVLQKLDETGKRRSTLVVFTSDNGGSTAENNDRKYPDDNCPNGKLPGNNRPWRGQKGELYEGGTRVPTLVQWPDRITPGKLDAPVQITDWMPTMTQLAGYSPPANHDLLWDGIDISRYLLQGEPIPNRSLYAVGPGWRGQSLRWQDWKLIVTEQGAGERLELFDMKQDPLESHNLAAEKPELTNAMVKRLQAAAEGDRLYISGSIK